MVKTKAYYARGIGFQPLSSVMDYNVFSKVIFGNEQTLGNAPEKILFYGDKVMMGNGSRMYGALIPAVLMHTYMINHHSYLPSLHDWVTGM